MQLEEEVKIQPEEYQKQYHEFMATVDSEHQLDHETQEEAQKLQKVLDKDDEEQLEREMRFDAIPFMPTLQSSQSQDQKKVDTTATQADEEVKATADQQEDGEDLDRPAEVPLTEDERAKQQLEAKLGKQIRIMKAQHQFIQNLQRANLHLKQKLKQLDDVKQPSTPRSDAQFNFDQMTGKQSSVSMSQTTMTQGDIADDQGYQEMEMVPLGPIERIRENQRGDRDRHDRSSRSPNRSRERSSSKPRYTNNGYQHRQNSQSRRYPEHQANGGHQRRPYDNGKYEPGFFEVRGDQRSDSGSPQRQQQNGGYQQRPRNNYQQAGRFYQQPPQQRMMRGGPQMMGRPALMPHQYLPQYINPNSHRNMLQTIEYHPNYNYVPAPHHQRMPQQQHHQQYKQQYYQQDMRPAQFMHNVTNRTRDFEDKHRHDTSSSSQQQFYSQRGGRGGGPRHQPRHYQQQNGRGPYQQKTYRKVQRDVSGSDDDHSMQHHEHRDQPVKSNHQMEYDAFEEMVQQVTVKADVVRDDDARDIHLMQEDE